MMLLVKGGMIIRVRQPLLKPVLTCSAFSSLARSKNPVLEPAIISSLTSNQTRQFGNFLKKIKVGWLIGPPPRPGYIWVFVTKILVLSIIWADLRGNLSCQVQVFPTPHFDYLRKRTTLRFFIVDILRMPVVQKCTQTQNFRGLPRLTKLTYF